jgi:2-C-methyl-D-erythritol 4-phosphate cytidylyltransferase
MTPPDFLARCVEIADRRDVVVVGVRPVTDTVKELDEGRLGATVDRDRLVSVCSPIVLPARVVADVDGLPTRDFDALLTWLRSAYDVEMVEAPAAARRVASDDDIRLLEALTGPVSR